MGKPPPSNIGLHDFFLYLATSLHCVKAVVER